MERYYYFCPLEQCPLQEGRRCTAYKNGGTRLIHDLLNGMPGPKLYREGRERLQSIEGCLEELQKRLEAEEGERQLV